MNTWIIKPALPPFASLLVPMQEAQRVRRLAREAGVTLGPQRIASGGRVSFELRERDVPALERAASIKITRQQINGALHG